MFYGLISVTDEISPDAHFGDSVNQRHLVENPRKRVAEQNTDNNQSHGMLEGIHVGGCEIQLCRLGATQYGELVDDRNGADVVLQHVTEGDTHGDGD